MKKMLSVLILGVMVFVLSGPGSALAATFGISASKTKIADAGGAGGSIVDIFGVGSHNMVVSGTTVYGAYTLVNATTNETEVYVGKSYDGGLTWKESELVARGADIDANGAAVAVATYQGAKYVHVAWGVDLAPAGYGAIYYSRAVDTGSDGWSWSTPTLVIDHIDARGAHDVYAPSRNIAADASGRVHVTASAYSLNTYQSAILYARSSDAGLSFTQETAITNAGSSPSLAATAAGDVFISWPGSGGMYFSKRLASGWTSPVVVSGIYGGDPCSIAAQDSSHISIAWGGTHPFQSSGAIYVASSSNGGSTWTQQQIYFGTPIYTGSSLSGGILSLAVSSTGVLSLVFEGVATLNTPSSLYFMRSSKSSWSAPVLIQTDGMEASVALNSSGKLCVMSSDNLMHAIYFTKEQ